MAPSARPPWLGIELRHLTALSAVAREGSFRGAADSLGYVQSAVSQQLAHLEQLVGARLIERRRGSTPVSLTPAGELLLEHFDGILGRFAAAQADIDALRDGRAGRIRVGVFESVAARLMPQLLVGLASRTPGVEVEMRETHDPDELAAEVAGGELDAAFGTLPLPAGPFEARELLRDPFVLLVPADWALAAAGSAPLEALGGLPLIACGAARLGRRVDSELRERGVEPRYVLRSESDAALQALVAAGIGAAVVPKLSIQPGQPGVATLELDDPPSPLLLALYWHRDRRAPDPLDVFRDAAARACVVALTEGRTYMLAA